MVGETSPSFPTSNSKVGMTVSISLSCPLTVTNVYVDLRKHYFHAKSEPRYSDGSLYSIHILLV